MLHLNGTKRVNQEWGNLWFGIAEHNTIKHYWEVVNRIYDVEISGDSIHAKLTEKAFKRTKVLSNLHFL